MNFDEFKKEFARLIVGNHPNIVIYQLWQSTQTNTRDDLLFNAHYSQVIITNESERNYCISWGGLQGFNVKYLESIKTYPFVFFPKDGGWNDSMDRAGNKFSFSEFVRILEDKGDGVIFVRQNENRKNLKAYINVTETE